MSSIDSRFEQEPLEIEREDQLRLRQRLHVLAYIRVGILILLLLAFALRMFRLDAQSLWYDEGVTAEIAQRSFEKLIEWTARDIQPPLYYQVVAGWGRLAGWSEWSLRFPSLFFGMLTLPLLYLVALRLNRSRTAAAVIILFAALHPLLIYYSQEARMYAQLVALCVLAAYFLLRTTIYSVNHGTESLPLWIGYVLTASAAIYTHYFAFFLLLALSIAYCLDLLLGGRPPENRYPLPGLRNFALVNVLILFFYLPWVNVMFARLAVDTSYWQGRFKVWEALRTIGITFVAGETMLEVSASQLLPTALVLTLLSILILAWRFVRGVPSALVGARVLLYPLLWLVVPIGVILLLASFVPKFNSRYVMIALPGLLLLWSSALATLLDPFFMRLRRENLDRAVDELGQPITLKHTVLGAMALAVCVFFFTIFLRSSANWFSDPAFTKAQWRELAAYMHEHVQENERVLLVSGHAWPIWRYYAPDVPAQRLPDIEILDVNSVLGYERSAALLASAFGRDAANAKENGWLISWQEEVVDPMDLVPLHLELAGREEPIDAQFWQLELRRFIDIDSESFQPAPPTMLDEPINFGHQLSLIAYAVINRGDLVLYWQPHGASMGTADLHIVLKTLTDQSLPYHAPVDRRPAGYLHPTFRWQTSDLAVGQIPALDWAGPGAIPGTYMVEIGVYDPQGDVAGLDVVGAEGQLLGKRARLELTLEDVVSAAPSADLADLIGLSENLSASVTLNAEDVEPGQPLFADIWWSVVDGSSAQDETALEVVWRERDSEAIVARSPLVLGDDIASTVLPTESTMHSVQALGYPEEVIDRPGLYWLDFQRQDAENGSIRKELEIRPSQRKFVAPPLATSINATFGNELRLLGTEEFLPEQVVAGSDYPLTIYWQVVAEAASDYTLTVQWLDDDGKPARQIDQALAGGSSTWMMDEVTGQTLTVFAPDDLGTYELILALYNGAESDFPRLSTEQGKDFVSLGTIEVRQ